MSQEEQSYPLTKPFWDGAHAGSLMIPQCQACHKWQWPVKYRCTRCGGVLRWTAATGRGTLLSWSEVLRAPRPELKALLPYVVVFVALEEGVRIMARLAQQEHLNLAMGQPVRCSFQTMQAEFGSIELPVFSIVEG